jgi:hypothetical protein
MLAVKQVSTPAVSVRNIGTEPPAWKRYGKHPRRPKKVLQKYCIEISVGGVKQVCLCVSGFGKIPNGMRITGGSHLPQPVIVARPKVFFILRLKI